MPGPAATVGSNHVCPMFNPGTPPPPHVGGPVSGPGVPTVLIGGKPAAVMGDMCVCAGPPDTIVMGVATVLIGGKPAATLGDMTAHGGSIVVGDPTVLIGTSKAVPSAVMPISQIPFPEIGMSSSANEAAAAAQESIKEAAAAEAAEAEETEKEPKVYNLRWLKEERKIKGSKVIKQVTFRASVTNIDDGETATVTIKRPVVNEETGEEEFTDDVIELSGTVQDKQVDFTWEVEDREQNEVDDEEDQDEEKHEENDENENDSAVASENNTDNVNNIAQTEEKKDIKRKDVVVFFIGGAGDKESFYGNGPTKIVDTYVKRRFDTKFSKNYNSFYLGYNEIKGEDDLNTFVYSNISDKEQTAIYIVGHSLGGWNGAHLSQILSDKGYIVDLLITLDPVGTGIDIKIISDIYVSTPKPKANYWINIYTDPKDYALDDFIADYGGQWQPKDGWKINHSTVRSHGQAGHMFTENLKDTDISASAMLTHFIKEYLKK